MRVLKTSPLRSPRMTGTTWHTPSSTQTGRAGFWNSVRCVLSSTAEELLRVNKPIDDVSTVNRDIGEAALGCGCSLRLWGICPPVSGVAASLNVSSQRCGTPFLVTRQTKILMVFLCMARPLIWLTNKMVLFLLPVCLPLLSLCFFPSSAAAAVAACFLRRYVPSQNQWIRRTVTVFPVGTPSRRMSPINSGALCCFRGTCENLETAMVYSHRQLPLLLWVHHSKCWSTSISNISSGFQSSSSPSGCWTGEWFTSR